MQQADQSIFTFMDALSSKAPAPGGGGASALIGAVGVALGHMVGALTLGKKKYADVEGQMQGIMTEAAALQQDFLQLIDEDATAFLPLAEAYNLPDNTPAERAEKAGRMEAGLKAAANVPLTIMEKCCSALDLVAVFAEKGSTLAVSDAGCAAAALRAALMGASLNVFVNTKLMEDRAHAAMLNARADGMLSAYGAQADAIYSTVENRLLQRESR